MKTAGRLLALTLSAALMLSATASTALAGNAYGKAGLMSQNQVTKQAAAQKGKSTQQQETKAAEIQQKQAKKLKHHFKDTAKNWAEAEILEATAKAYVKGYTDGTFRPDATVSKLEAVVMAVRAAGGEEALAEYADAVDDPALKNIPAWGRPYVALAIKEGILTSDEAASLNPSAAADRADVAVYVGRLNGEAVAEDSEDISLTDASSIPLRARPYICALVKAGVVNGYPDGTFRPGQYVKRSEICAMLNRADRGFLAKAKRHACVVGVISGVEQVDGQTVVTMRLLTGNPNMELFARIALPEEQTVVYDRSQMALSDLTSLTTGDIVRINPIKGAQLVLVNILAYKDPAHLGQPQEEPPVTDADELEPGDTPPVSDSEAVNEAEDTGSTVDESNEASVSSDDNAASTDDGTVSSSDTQSGTADQSSSGEVEEDGSDQSSSSDTTGK